MADIDRYIHAARSTCATVTDPRTGAPRERNCKRRYSVTT